jgi:HlyD family secretion protein
VKRLSWILLALLILTVATGIIFRSQLTSWLNNYRATSDELQTLTDAGTVPARSREGSIWALGRLEPAGGVVDVSAMPGDRVLEILVGEGAAVTPETELATLESKTLRDLDVQLARTQLEEAKDRLAVERAAAEAKAETARLTEQQADETAKLELAAEERKLDVLRTAATQAAKDLERLQSLAAEKPELVIAQDVERQQLMHTKATAELAAGEAAFHSAKAAAEYQLRLARQQREAAETAVAGVEKSIPIDSLQQQVLAAEKRQAQAVLRAPITGTVLRVLMQNGESVAQRPILQIADLQQMQCVAEVAHDQRQFIREGQTARIRSKAFGDDEKNYLVGTVTKIGIVAGDPQLKQIDPFAATDRLSLEVRIALDPSSSRIAAEFVNLQVDVEFLADEPAQESP